jgi:hypothetical protein
MKDRHNQSNTHSPPPLPPPSPLLTSQSLLDLPHYQAIRFVHVVGVSVHGNSVVGNNAVRNEGEDGCAAA